MYHDWLWLYRFIPCKVGISYDDVSRNSLIYDLSSRTWEEAVCWLQVNAVFRLDEAFSPNFPIHLRQCNNERGNWYLLTTKLDE